MSRYAVIVVYQVGHYGEARLVKIDDEKQWSDTIRYLEDAGIRFHVQSTPITPGELSDLLAPRDE